MSVRLHRTSRLAALPVGLVLTASLLTACNNPAEPAEDDTMMSEEEKDEDDTMMSDEQKDDAMMSEEEKDDGEG